MKRTRIEAAKALLLNYNAMEVRRITLKTAYNKVFRDDACECWRLQGHGYDHTIFD